MRRQYHPRVLHDRIRFRCRSASRCARLAAVLALIGAITALVAPSASAADRSVAVVVVPSFAPEAYADRGAVGLLVPGAGATVSRERALASLVRGRVVSSLVDLGGTTRLQLANAPARTTIYVALPPPGTHHNVVRYPVAIVGPGFRGLLTSPSTRIDGLVSLADIAPTAEAIAAGEVPPIRVRADDDAGADARPPGRAPLPGPRCEDGSDTRARGLARRVRRTGHSRPLGDRRPSSRARRSRGTDGRSGAEGDRPRRPDDDRAWRSPS